MIWSFHGDCMQWSHFCDKPYADGVSAQCSGDCLHVHYEGSISDAAACYTYCLDIYNMQPFQYKRKSPRHWILIPSWHDLSSKETSFHVSILLTDLKLHICSQLGSQCCRFTTYILFSALKVSNLNSPLSVACTCASCYSDSAVGSSVLWVHWKLASIMKYSYFRIICLPAHI